MLPRCHYFCWRRKLCRSTAKHGGSAAKHEGGAVSASKCFHQGMLCSMPTIRRIFCRTQYIHALQHAYYHALPLCLLLLGCSLLLALLGCSLAAPRWLMLVCCWAAPATSCWAARWLLLGCSLACSLTAPCSPCLLPACAAGLRLRCCLAACWLLLVWLLLGCCWAAAGLLLLGCRRAALSPPSHALLSLSENLTKIMLQRLSLNMPGWPPRRCSNLTSKKRLNLPYLWTTPKKTMTKNAPGPGSKVLQYDLEIKGCVCINTYIYIYVCMCVYVLYFGYIMISNDIQW